MLNDQQWRIDKGQSSCCCASGKEHEHNITNCLTVSIELSSIQLRPKGRVSCRLPFALGTCSLKQIRVTVSANPLQYFAQITELVNSWYGTALLRGTRCSISISTRHTQTNTAQPLGWVHRHDCFFINFFIHFRRHVLSHKQHEVFIRLATCVWSLVRRYQGGSP